VCGHHAELALLDEGDQILNLLLQRRLLEVLLLVWVGWVIACIRVAERRHLDFVCSTAGSLFQEDGFVKSEFELLELPVTRRKSYCWMERATQAKAP
jgi:hypothetical protein